MQAAQATLRQSHGDPRRLASGDDASRTGYAEAKIASQHIGHHLSSEAKVHLRRPVGHAEDASRTGYAEAKFLLQLVRILVGDASCTGYAEAKAMSVMWFANTSRCKPHRLLCKAKANACRKAGNI